MKLYIMSDAMTVVKVLCTGQREKKMGVSGVSEFVVMKLVIFYNRVCEFSLFSRKWIKETGMA